MFPTIFLLGLLVAAAYGTNQAAKSEDAPIEHAKKHLKVIASSSSSPCTLVLTGRRFGWVNTSYINAVYDPVGTVNSKPYYVSRTKDLQGRTVYLYWNSQSTDWEISYLLNSPNGPIAICAQDVATPETCTATWQVYNRDVTPNAFQDDPEVSMECVCNIAISGREGFNSIINDVYNVAGVNHKHPFYFGVSQHLFLYFYDPTMDWVIGRTTGSKRVLAVNEQPKRTADKVTMHWQVMDGYDFRRDFSVQTNCH